MSNCRGRWVEYEYDNVPGGQWRTKLDAAGQLCDGCPFKQPCARLALKCHALGMVWAGVPIPPKHNSKMTARAHELLVEVALYG